MLLFVDLATSGVHLNQHFTAYFYLHTSIWHAIGRFLETWMQNYLSNKKIRFKYKCSDIVMFCLHSKYFLLCKTFWKFCSIFHIQESTKVVFNYHVILHRGNNNWVLVEMHGQKRKIQNCLSESKTICQFIVSIRR